MRGQRHNDRQKPKVFRAVEPCQQWQTCRGHHSGNDRPRHQDRRVADKGSRACTRRQALKVFFDHIKASEAINE